MNEVIKEYLVSLGFGVDDNSLAKFNKAIESAAVRVTSLYAAVQTMAAGIFYAISNSAKGFEQIGYELKILAPAINKALILRQELFKAYKSAGVNLVQAIQNSARFNLSLTKTEYALKAIYNSVAARFFPLLTKQMDLFRKQIYANMPKIQNALEKFVKFMFKAFEIIVDFGKRFWSILSRIYDFLVMLDTATGGWSTKILAFAAAWKILNLSFLATPLGMLISGITALIALWDDFQVWKEGGESYFNWADDSQDKVVKLTYFLIDLYNALLDISTIAADIYESIFDLLNLDFSKFGDHMENAFKGLENFLFPGINYMPQVLGQQQSQAPLLGNLGAGLVNQNVNQQTSIVVQGSPDAQATGQTVANQQGRVNFNLTRNLKSAAK